jgi:biotin synthase
MGPYIPDPGTPLAGEPCPPVEERMRLALLMIAAARLVCRDVNIASTTALQTLDPLGREKGLRFGANVLMPQTTPPDLRRSYMLYPGKSNLNENAQTFHKELEARLAQIGRTIRPEEWGDSRHARRRGAGRKDGN